MADGFRSGCYALGALSWLVALGGCANTEKRMDEELQELVQWLPGHYDNSAQVQSDQHQGVKPAHDAVALDILQIDAPMIGDNAFYLQETAPDDPRRIFVQRVLLFAVVNKDIVQTSFTLVDPQRWRSRQLDADLFKSLMTQDVRTVKGCSLRWKKTAARFTATNDPKLCHVPSRVGSGQAQLDVRAELAAEEYSIAEIGLDQAGHLLWGRRDEPFYRFRKQAREPPGADQTE